jgi:hypothetical protein
VWALWVVRVGRGSGVWVVWVGRGSGVWVVGVGRGSGVWVVGFGEAGAGERPGIADRGGAPSGEPNVFPL